MQLDKGGAESWGIATGKAIGKQLAFILDNRLLYVAKVNAQITNGMTTLNRGNYTKQELENFKTIIESEK
jgi:preprotein translocase subunit SecD